MTNKRKKPNKKNHKKISQKRTEVSEDIIEVKFLPTIIPRDPKEFKIILEQSYYIFFESAILRKDYLALEILISKMDELQINIEFEKISIFIDYIYNEKKGLNIKKIQTLLKNQYFMSGKNFGGIKIENGKLSPDFLEKQLLHNGINSLIKALFKKGNNHQFFEEAMVSFEEYSQKGSDSHVVSYFSKHTLLSYRSENSWKLENTLLKNGHSSTKEFPSLLAKASYIANLSYNCHSIFYYDDAYNHALNAYDIYLDHIKEGGNKENGFGIIKNLIIICFSLNYKETIKYCEEAKKHGALDREIIEYKYKSYLYLKQYQQAEEELKKDLLTIDVIKSIDDSSTIESFKSSLSKPLTSSEKKHMEEYYKLLETFKDITNSTPNIEKYSQLLNEFEKIKDSLVLVDTVKEISNILCLFIFQLNLEPKLILDFYEEQCLELPQLQQITSIRFRHLELLLYINNNLFDKALISLTKINIQILRDKIDKFPVSLEFAQSAGKLYLGALISTKEYEKAKDYLAQDEILETVEKLKFSKMIQSLEPKDQLEDQENDFDEEINNQDIDGDDITLIVQIDTATTKEEVEEIVNYSPQLIHKYFQFKKQLINNRYSDLNKKKNGWTIKNDINNSQKIVDIKDDIYPIINKENFYAIIDEKLLKKLDIASLGQYQAALKKGVVARKEGENGIKFINNIIELKINGDLRLWADKIYKNPNGEYLIIFDHVGNHVKVKNTVDSNKKISIIDVPFIEVKVNVNDLDDNDKQSLGSMNFNEEEFQEFCIKAAGDSADE